MASDQKCFHVVTGMHRSGTTLVGQILSMYSDLHVIHEPLNKEYGLCGVKDVYPCDLDQKQRHYYLLLLERLVAGKADYIRHSSHDSWMKSLTRLVSGGPTGVDVIKFRMRRLFATSLTPVLKDPFEVMLSDGLTENGHKVIALVRHPAAIWLSIKRMEWQFSFADFAYAGVFRDLDVAVPTAQVDSLIEVEKLAWLWTVIYSYLARLTESENILVIRHEDLCVRPYDELERIELFLGLKADPEPRKFINMNMFAKVITPLGKQLHAFERDSKNLVTAWCEQIGDDEDILRDICGPLVERYYGNWK